MESLLMELQSGANPRRSSLQAAALDQSKMINGKYQSFRGSGSFSAPLGPQFSPMNDLFFYPPRLYSSLPPVPVQRQPPLLPLPVKSATLPSTNKKVGVAPARQANSQKKKKKRNQQQQLARAGSGLRKSATLPSTNKKDLEASKAEEPDAAEKRPSAAAAAEEGLETGEEFFVGSPPLKSPLSTSVYSLSPPPSSLPLPGLLLLRPRQRKVAAGSSSCTAEAMVDSGASDDLRRLLRL